MSLVRAELSRFFARRFILIMVAFILLLLGVIAMGFAMNTQRITDSDRAAAAAQAARYADDQRAWMEQEYQRCVVAQAAGSPDFPAGFDCEQFRDKGVWQPDAENYLPPHFNFRDEIETTLYIAAAILGLFGFVVGASFVGAEWTSGGLTNLLLWRPRRVPLLAAKLGTAVAAVGAIGVLFLAAWVGTMWTIGALGGVTGDTTSGFWQSTGLTSLRALAIGLAAAAAGFALASLGRRTAAALGVGIGYALIAEIGTLIVFQVINTAFPERFRLSTYFAAWMSKELRLTDYGICRYSFGGCEPREFIVNMQLSSWVIGTVVVALVAGALYSFQRRDVS